MAKKDEFRMPMGMGGLVRYGDEPKDAIKIKPEYVIAFSLAVIFIELMLRFFV